MSKSVSTADRAAPLTAAELQELFADLADCPLLILAVSGGPDSTALLVLAARWRKALKRGPKLIALTIDHGLRPEAKREAAAVKRLARSLGVAHQTLRWTGPRPSAGLQEAARQARYRLLASAAQKAGARHVLTAHTLDDQAETVLIRLTRGSGIAGLSGMARLSRLPADDESRIALVRPLLDVPKARLVATLRKSRIPFAEDPSNRDPRFTRARLREAMPVLEREGLGQARLAVLARRLRRADAALEAAVDEAQAELIQGPRANGEPIELAGSGYAKLPPEIALRLLGRAIASVGSEGPVELGKLEALWNSLAATPDAVRFRRTLAGAVITRTGADIVVERAPARRGQTATKRP